MNTQHHLTECARAIANHQGYTVLINGLQPVEDYEIDGIRKPGLRSKFAHEREEFEEAGDFWHQVHEAADLLYYSACISEQTGDNSYSETFSETLRGLANLLHLSSSMLEAAALAKYQWRAEQAGNKDEAYEIKLIAQAIGARA